jgi:hypothetical protein
MSSYNPIEVPLISGLIAQAVKKFAQDRAHDYDLCYHDKPIWRVVSFDLTNNIFREVQVSAFLTEDGEELSFVPRAYSVGYSAKVTAPNGTQVQKILLRDLFLTTSTPPFKLDEIAIIAAMEKLLLLAWATANTFTRADLR